MPKPIIFGIIRSLHDLFTALWIGGLLTTAISFMPTLKKSSKNKPWQKDLMSGYQQRLRIVAIISIFGLWLTGILLGRQSSAYAGFLSFSSTYNTLITIKHLMIFVMIVVVVYRGFILGRKIENFSTKDQKIYGFLLLINTVLGISVIFLSGISAALG